MGKTNERRRQAILTRKKAKRKNKSRNRLANALGNRETSPFHGAESPIHECLVPVEIFEIGIGNVIVSRGLASGEIGMAAFLVDVFCRGVKDALYVTVDPYEYVRITAELHDLEEMQQVAPCCAMKLVEGAVDHARQSGIEPHHGYQKAKKIFGGIDPGECTCEYEFGFDDEFFAKRRKVSEMISEMAGDFIRQGSTAEQRQTRLNVACSAWNIACRPPEYRLRHLDEVVKKLRQFNPDQVEDTWIELVRDFETLIDRKLQMFPDDNRQIVSARIVPLAQDFRIEVASTTFERPRFSSQNRKNTNFTKFSAVRPTRFIRHSKG